MGGPTGDINCGSGFSRLVFRSKSSRRYGESPATIDSLKISTLKFIAENAPSVLPDISERSILDKSKANGLAKLLVCLQASWFCAQIIGRLATAGNPISLLELNTFLHAICCLTTYGAWWRKPLDIQEPETIDVSEEENFAFYARLCYREQRPRCKRLSPTISDTRAYLTRALGAGGPRHARVYKDSYTFAFESSDVTQDIEETIQNLGPEKYRVILRLYDQQICYGYHPSFESDYVVPGAYVELRWADIEWLRLADQLFRTDQPMRQSEVFVDHASMVKSPDKTLKRLTPSSATKTSMLDYVLWLCVMAAGAIYGCVHLLAWNGPFNTYREQWMWRVSSIVVASPILILPSFLTPAAVIYTKVIRDGLADKIVKGVIYFAAVAFALVYSAARIFLVVECFINLSHLPPEVYKEPTWSRYIPHLSAG
ncbi:hypothetical protein OPT61_g5945 [Boeremia exigua]|uniref:Uncharacterized protein n=1 Tax=Boeremia exigua TaxID=749465 RepID=A0ACC2I8G5_9PLEO|nr:hypothetical protein OPT61_g5945 [Boeremia exigua]